MTLASDDDLSGSVEQLALAHIAHNRHAADAGRQNERACPAAVFLVLCSERDEVLCLRAKRLHRTIGADEILHTVSICRRDEAARRGDADRREHPPRNRLTMQQLLVLCGCFNRVPQRVARGSGSCAARTRARPRSQRPPSRARSRPPHRPGSPRLRRERARARARAKRTIRHRE